MRFYRHLYTSDHIRHPGYLRWRLRRHAGSLDVYVVTLCGMDEPCVPMDGQNQLEFYHNVFLQQPYYRSHEPYIVGIASSRTEAIELCARIIQEAVTATGHADVYPYLFPDGRLEAYFTS